MKNFRDEYRKAMDCLKVPVVTPEQILDEGRQKKILKMKRRRQFIAIGSAACLFLLCSVGVAGAAGYAKSMIKANDCGFQTSGMSTAQIPPELEIQTEECGEEGFDSAATDNNVEGTSGYSTEDKQRQYEETADGAQAAVCDVEKLEENAYTSFDEYRKAEDMPLAIPPLDLLGEEIISQEYFVTGGNFLLVRLEAESCCVIISQSYYGDMKSHASSTVYAGGVCNERTYITESGFDWLVVDSVCEAGEPSRIHAAVSVGDYELIVDFSGYAEEEAFSILNAMDLTIYLE